MVKNPPIIPHVERYAAIAALLLLCNSPLAATRNCTAAEKADADAQLLSIQEDETRRAEIEARHLPFSAHRGTHASQGGPDNEDLLLQDGYALKHDKDLRTTLWVSYRLTNTDINNASGKDRVNCFRRDPRMAYAETGVPADYDEPIFDQGHMANDADMKDELLEQINTYVMSNMSPQYCRFNRGIWLSLEHLGRIWAKKYEKIYITSGAIFDFYDRDARDKDQSAARMGSRNQNARVAIPSGYYKLFLRKEGDTWYAITFLLDHNNERNGVKWSEVRPTVEDAIETLEDVEARAEVTFYPELDRAQLVQSTGADWDFSVGKSNLESSCR